jgi:D-sedoheptulose 7-phosphate isomerase
MPFARQLAVLAQAQDIALGFSQHGLEDNILAAFGQAKEMGLLTLGMTGKRSGNLADAGLDFLFAAGGSDALVVQEVHETLYHILWELVHIFLENEGLLV